MQDVCLKVVVMCGFGCICLGKLQQLLYGQPEVGLGLPVGAQVLHLSVGIEAEASEGDCCRVVGRVVRPDRRRPTQVVQLWNSINASKSCTPWYSGLNST